MLPNGKTEYTASKTVQLNPYSNNDVNAEHVELQTYGLPNNYGQLETLSHTESVTASYAPRPQPYLANAGDIYHKMEQKNLSPEEVYIINHPNENYYDYQPAKENSPQDYKYENYHAKKKNQALEALTPIIAALEVSNNQSPAKNNYNTQYTIEKSVHKDINNKGQNYLPPVVQKSKYTYFDPAHSASDKSLIYHPPPPPPVPYKIQHIVSPRHKRKTKPLFKAQDYEIEEPLLFNRVFMF